MLSKISSWSEYKHIVIFEYWIICTTHLISMHVFFEFWITRVTWLAWPLPLHKTNRAQDDNLSGVKTITKQALHHLAGQRLVSIQEAVHMVNKQELVISSDKMIYLSLAQGQALRDECDTHAKKDLITMYQTDIKNTTNYLLSISFIKSSYNQHSIKKQRTIPTLPKITTMNNTL